ncbi:MAG: glycosyl transferase family 2 [Sulfobacillus acidophilus]|uniref:Glycosyl transferase family 2 n=1 Tax=Sulfobacillus acidophilus TaxID=53633 RepID=A0A2T2WKC0_9FIRM|nr:MAG: glycosyl transferase family 2 [Sulfobacillus acidophilus]
MMSEISQRWDATPWITLISYVSGSKPLIETVDRSAAFAVSREDARTHGLLPFAWDSGNLCVAVAEPPSLQARLLLDRIGPVKWYRTTAIDLVLAQREIYGDLSDRPAPFGELARQRGLSQEALDELLRMQQNQGGLLGSLATAHQHLTSWDVAEILSAQTGIPTQNLLQDSPAASPELLNVWHLLTEKEWRDYEMVPVAVGPDTITVALTNPFDTPGRRKLSLVAKTRVKAVLTGHRDILARLDQQYRANNLVLSRTLLLHRRPDDSATQTLTKSQKWAGVALVVALIAALIFDRDVALSVVSSLFVLIYALLVVHRLWIIRKGTLTTNELRFAREEVENLSDSDLPIYTILIPARDEANVLNVLTEALSRLDYPKDRLDVKLLLEEDDVETIAAARRAKLPSFMEITIVPPEEPRTKPKALNFGLQRARGEFVTIYDAEDIPEPSQLKKALLAFRQSDDTLACVQAKLSYFNIEQNLLTRWFTAEYSVWFNLLLPSLHAASLPIPLGGTSNHFRTEVLRNIGAWDPYNVTEDADLGIRLNKSGYRTAVMDSYTYEEANSEFVNWVRQRSRWIKGYLQTWLVHMRHPVQLHRQLGARGFWGFQLAILGTPIMFILNPLYWLITSLWFMTNWGLIPHLFPPGIYYLGMLNLLAGNFVFAYLNAVGAAKDGHWSLVPYAILTPLYWTMMSLASWKALLQLMTRPSHWEKTHHGLTDWNPVTAADHRESAEISA